MRKKYFSYIIVSLIMNVYTYSQFLDAGSLIKSNNLTIYEFYNDTDTNAFKKTVLRIDSLYQNGKYKQALSIVNNIIRNDSSFFPVYAIRAFINYDITEYKECINDCNHLLEYADLQEILMIRGLAYYQTGEYANAKMDFDKLVTIDKKYYLLYSIWSNYLAASGDCAEASEYCKMALNKCNDVGTYYYAAKYYLLCEKTDSALYYVNKTLDSARYVDAYMLRASIKYALEDYDGYEQDLDTVIFEIDKILKQIPFNFKLYHIKYQVLMSYDEFYSALEVLDTMLYYQPSSEIYLEKYYLCKKTAMNDEAETSLNKAIEMDSTSSHMISFLIETYTEQKKYNEVIKLCSKMIDQSGNKYEQYDVAYAYRKRGNAKFLSGKKAEGCEDIQKAASMGDGDAKSIMEETCKLIKK